MRGAKVRLLAALAAVLLVLAACTSGSEPPSPPDRSERGSPRTPIPSPFQDSRFFYVDPEANVVSWLNGNRGDGRAGVIEERIARQATARWIGPGDNTHRRVSGFVNAAYALGQLPVLVGYNIPNRDCGNHSAGGARSADEYLRWVDVVARAIGDRPALIVLEPDAVIHFECLDEAGRQERKRILTAAVATLNRFATSTWVYLDGGDGAHNPADRVATGLAESGLGTGARGFAVNVSNFNSTEDAARYGNDLKRVLSTRYGIEAGFVIDISRNGNGSDGSWCNPGGRSLGAPPQVGGPGGADALLWVKRPGESDGDCGVGAGTSSGAFYPELAMRLINGD
ncbi:glycoside hydrolase family 6 protein [Allokutzneria sp. A3M-2-11 16]|uniref:glycoside hydrolase family 6 protein n=1 Tax=Allokutzneria sp. A3M-2-11 16 TaxID=2962043 RepID=UPI0020B813B3|nr:glycoside hydrolase family 6 protein [Allokutzneria sp. A3M-2-11 16]MCP3801114.1 glycoside hydrolase family 6 protein [Allokutzneria sp. A3M-2-11 16]